MQFKVSKPTRASFKWCVSIQTFIEKQSFFAQQRTRNRLSLWTFLWEIMNNALSTSSKFDFFIVFNFLLPSFLSKTDKNFKNWITIFFNIRYSWCADAILKCYFVSVFAFLQSFNNFNFFYLTISWLFCTFQTWLKTLPIPTKLIRKMARVSIHQLLYEANETGNAIFPSLILGKSRTLTFILFAFHPSLSPTDNQKRGVSAFHTYLPSVLKEILATNFISECLFNFVFHSYFFLYS